MRQTPDFTERFFAADAAAQRHASRGEILAGLLEGKINDDRLEPGDRLGTKEEIRENSGFAVATVNEALRLLVERGRVVVRPGLGGGVFVAEQPLTVRLGRMLLAVRGTDSYSLADATVVRNGLDPLVMVDVAQHRTRRDVERLRNRLAEMARAVDDSDAFLDANWSFHTVMAGMCRNTVLGCIYIGLMETIRGATGTVTGEATTVDRSERLAIHAQIVDAIEARDLDRLKEAAHSHEIVAVPTHDDSTPRPPRPGHDHPQKTPTGRQSAQSPSAVAEGARGSAGGRRASQPRR